LEYAKFQGSMLAVYLYWPNCLLTW